MLVQLYDRLLEYSRSRYAPHLMCGVSFLDSSMLPIPPHPFLGALGMARPDRAYLWAFLCTAASVIGGFLGYAIGSVLYDPVGLWVIEKYGYQQQIEGVRELFAEWGFWLIVIKGLTPIPFKIVTIGAGFSGFDLIPFFFASIISRSIQFYAIAWILRHKGGQLDAFARRYGNTLGWAVVALVVIALVIHRYA
jgi:membrane protein YqaA with SNARE-associated domain